MRVRWRAAAIAAVALAAACGGADDLRRRGPGEPALRLWNPTIVRWEAGQPRHLDFAVENPTNRTLEIAAPDPAGARVDVFAGPESFRVCGVAPSGSAGPAGRVALAPGDRVTVRVDLDRACGSLPPGEYRFAVSYETSYAARPAPRRPRDEREDDKETRDAFTGTLPAHYGQLLVSAPPAAVACTPDGGPQPRAAAGPARQGRAAAGAERAARRTSAKERAPPEARR